MRIIERRKKSKAFTLFEVLLVLTLICIALGTGGYFVPKAIRSERFEKGVAQLIETLHFAGELMLDTEGDVTLTLVQEEKGIHCDLQPSAQMPRHLQNVCGERFIKGVTRMEFDKAPCAKLTLSYLASTAECPTGTLTLSGAGEKTLHLPPVPQHIITYEETTLTPAPYPHEAELFLN